MQNHLAHFWNTLWDKHLKFIVLVLIVTLASFCSFLAAHWLSPAHPKTSIAINRVGELMLTVVALQLVTRFWVSHQAESAFFARLKIRDSVLKSGFQDFYWFDKIPWDDLFQSATDIEIFAITARSLTGERIGLVRSYLKRQNTKLTIIIHDPDDIDAMSRFDTSFGEQPGTRRSKIVQNVQEIRDLLNNANIPHEKVSIRFTRATPGYTYYRFDDRVLYVPYLIKPHARAPDHIPAFLFDKGEVLEKFISIDSAYIRETSRIDAAPKLDEKITAS
ncbi:hypothetical protein HUW63_25730 [Myxococcus sp. AM001]|nr:hypothetical protein [Myxococcus sp. AM001]